MSQSGLLLHSKPISLKLLPSFRKKLGTFLLNSLVLDIIYRGLKLNRLNLQCIAQLHLIPSLPPVGIIAKKQSEGVRFN